MVAVPDGVWFKKFHIMAGNAPDTLLLNISKFKLMAGAYSLCKTCRNNCHELQAIVLHTEILWMSQSSHLNPTANADILHSYNRHVSIGIPRWDRPGSEGGIWMETWRPGARYNL